MVNDAVAAADIAVVEMKILSRRPISFLTTGRRIFLDFGCGAVELSECATLLRVKGGVAQACRVRPATVFAWIEVFSSSSNADEEYPSLLNRQNDTLPVRIEASTGKHRRIQTGFPADHSEREVHMRRPIIRSDRIRALLSVMGISCLSLTVD